MSHLLLLSAQHISGKVIKINLWRHRAMYSVMFAVFFRWKTSEIFSLYTISPACHKAGALYSMCYWKQHGPGRWHRVHGDAYWFMELSCSLHLTVSDSSITRNLIAWDPQVASKPAPARTYWDFHDTCQAITSGWYGGIQKQQPNTFTASKKKKNKQKKQKERK